MNWIKVKKWPSSVQAVQGKTTLLNLVGALDTPDSGEVMFNGTNITGYNSTQLAAFRNLNLGFVFSNASFNASVEYVGECVVAAFAAR